MGTDKNYDSDLIRKPSTEIATGQSTVAQIWSGESSFSWQLYFCLDKVFDHALPLIENIFR